MGEETGLNTLRVMRLVAVMVVLVALVAAAAVAPGAALAADRWNDISDEQWVSTYAVSAEQVWTVATGYDDGSFRPYQAVTRAQLAKMAVNGFGLATVQPAIPTFRDVSLSHPLYAYVESAYAAGIVGGFTDGSFKPDEPVTRQQANSILGRFLSEAELSAMAVIWGLQRNYPSLEAWYQGEAGFWLGVFSDLSQLDAVHRPTTGYLVYHDVVNGSQSGTNFYLSPLSSLSRAQAVVMVLRTYQALDEVAPGPPPAPTGLATFPAGPSPEGCPSVSGRTLPGGLVTLYDTFGGKTVALAAVYADEITGDFSLRVPLEAPLAEGSHLLTARVRSRRMLWSESSLPLTYLVDASPPQVSVSTPADGRSVPNAAPSFRVSATDTLTAVSEVRFQYARDGAGATFYQISADATAPFEAEWGALSLPDGVYAFRAEAEDQAGNTAVSQETRVTIDTVAPAAEIIQPESPGTGEPLVTADATPDFTVLAYDLPSPLSSFTGSISRVDFYYAPAGPSGEPPTEDDFAHLSSDYVINGFGLYDADWGEVRLGEGSWALAARAVDEAGNVSPLVIRVVAIDTLEVP